MFHSMIYGIWDLLWCFFLQIASFDVWKVLFWRFDMICFFILSIQTLTIWRRKPFYSRTQDDRMTRWQGTKVTPSFVIITTKFLLLPSRIRTSSPQWAWAHHQASAMGLKPRWWKTGCKMYDEAEGLWGIELLFYCNDSIAGWRTQGPRSNLLHPDKAPKPLHVASSWCFVPFGSFVNVICDQSAVTFCRSHSDDDVSETWDMPLGV